MMTPDQEHPEEGGQARVGGTGSVREILDRVEEDTRILEPGMTLLETEFRLVGSLAIDLLATDQSGRLVAILAGDHEDPLLVRCLDILRAWDSVSHLLKRIYKEAGFDLEEGPRVVLICRRFSDRFVELVRRVGPPAMDLREAHTAVIDGRPIPVLLEARGATLPVRPASRQNGCHPAAPAAGPPAAGPIARSHPEASRSISNEPRVEENGTRGTHSPERDSGWSSPNAPTSIPSPSDHPREESGREEATPEHALYDDARRKIMRIDDAIREETQGDRTLFRAGNHVVASLRRRPHGLVGTLGGADDEPAILLGDRRTLNAFLNRAFRHYFTVCPDSEGPAAGNADRGTLDRGLLEKEAS